MPRYGDLDKLAVKWRLASPSQRQNFGEIIESHPASDVATKSEVDKLRAVISELQGVIAGYEAIMAEDVAEKKQLVKDISILVQKISEPEAMPGKIEPLCMLNYKVGQLVGKFGKRKEKGPDPDLFAKARTVMDVANQGSWSQDNET